MKPKYFIFTYILLIIVYAALYFYIPYAVKDPKNFTFIKSLYFSTVTITTLGYGDITPNSEIGMFIVATEAIAGILIIGLFLSSLWQSFADKIEAEQNRVINNSIAEQNLRRLKSFYIYLKVVIEDFQFGLFELTTPIDKRSHTTSNIPREDFIFSDLKDIYNISLVITSGFQKSVIHHYYDKQDLLLNELKFLLANFDMNEYSIIHEKTIEFLALSKKSDVREALYSYETMGSKGMLLKDELAKMIKEQDKCPEIEQYEGGNLIMPAIFLYHTVKSQMTLTSALKDEFEELTDK